MLLDKIKTDIVIAMKAKDELRLNTLRSIKMTLDKFLKDNQQPNPSTSLTEVVEQKLLGTLAKQRREASLAFSTGNRPELAAKEEAELKILEAYMAQEATEEEVTAAIEESLIGLLVTGPKAMGVVMKSVQQKLVGKRVDGKILSEKIKTRLATI